MEIFRTEENNSVVSAELAGGNAVITTSDSDAEASVTVSPAVVQAIAYAVKDAVIAAEWEDIGIADIKDGDTVKFVYTDDGSSEDIVITDAGVVGTRHVLYAGDRLVLSWPVGKRMDAVIFSRKVKNNS